MAAQLPLFDCTDRVRVRVASGWREGTIVRELAKPRRKYHGRLVLVRFDEGRAKGPRRVRSYSGCLLIVDLDDTQAVPSHVPRFEFDRAEAARVARSAEKFRQAAAALFARYAPRRARAAKGVGP